ncbi:hypothetical protein [Arthrobacter sp. MDT1-65]
MTNSRLIPAQLPDESESSAVIVDPVIPARGEFILSGSLTPLPHDSGTDDLPGTPVGPMPGFHHRKEVQLMLRRWRNGLSLWGRILSSPSHGSREARDRLLLPSHSMYIR